MNILLWIAQGVLALLLISGGGYKLFQSAQLAAQFDAIPPLVWMLIGIVEIGGGVMLLLPTSRRFTPNLTSITAMVMLVESIGLSLFYARYSTSVSAENPLMWSALMTVLLGFVAYGRYVPAASASRAT